LLTGPFGFMVRSAAHPQEARASQGMFTYLPQPQAGAQGAGTQQAGASQQQSGFAKAQRTLPTKSRTGVRQTLQDSQAGSQAGAQGAGAAQAGAQGAGASQQQSGFAKAQRTLPTRSRTGVQQGLQAGSQAGAQAGAQGAGAAQAGAQGAGASQQQAGWANAQRTLPTRSRTGVQQGLQVSQVSQPEHTGPQAAGAQASPASDTFAASSKAPAASIDNNVPRFMGEAPSQETPVRILTPPGVNGDFPRNPASGIVVWPSLASLVNRCSPTLTAASTLVVPKTLSLPVWQDIPVVQPIRNSSGPRAKGQRRHEPQRSYPCVDFFTERPHNPEPSASKHTHES
jgi:hypothetical protein